MSFEGLQHHPRTLPNAFHFMCAGLGEESINPLLASARKSTSRLIFTFQWAQVCKREDGTPWVLGRGSFGIVNKALRRGVQEVAIKTVLYVMPSQSPTA